MQKLISISRYRLSFLISALCLTLFFLGLGFYVLHSAHARLSFLETQLARHQLHLDIEKSNWAWNGIKFSSIKIEGENIRLAIKDADIKAQINLLSPLNPIRMRISLKDLHFFWQLTEDMPTKQSRADNSHLEKAGKDSLAQKLKLIGQIIQEFNLQSAAGTVVDSEGQTLYAADGMKVYLDADKGTLDYGIERLRYRNRSFLKKVEGNLIIDSEGSNFPFLVSNGSGLEKNWEARGHISRDLKSLSLFMKSRGIPSEWTGFYTDMIPNRELINYAIRLKLARSGRGQTQIDLQLGSTNFSFFHPSVAQTEVGPTAFQSRFSGYFHDRSGSLEGHGFVHLISRENRHDKITSQFRILKRDILNQSEHDPWRVQMHLAESPCHLFQKVLPSSILGELSKFQVEGKLGFQVELTVPLGDLSAFQLGFSSWHDSCQWEGLDHLYTLDFLRRRQPSPDMTMDPQAFQPQTRAMTSKYFTQQLGPYLPLLLVAAEDTGFWGHNGVEVSAIEAALRQNIRSGRIAVGGSTITMQTAKNLFLDHERTLARKFQELVLARYLETRLSKNEILTIYANIIEYGPALYGIEKASRVFFNRSAKDLTATEALYLASILPSPRTYLINYCRRELNEATIKRMEQVKERYENMRLSHTNPSSFNLDELRFQPSGPYAHHYCPLTIAQPSRMGRL